MRFSSSVALSVALAVGVVHGDITSYITQTSLSATTVWACTPVPTSSGLTEATPSTSAASAAITSADTASSSSHEASASSDSVTPSISATSSYSSSSSSSTGSIETGLATNALVASSDASASASSFSSSSSSATVDASSSITSAPSSSSTASSETLSLSASLSSSLSTSSTLDNSTSSTLNDTAAATSMLVVSEAIVIASTTPTETATAISAPASTVPVASATASVVGGQTVGSTILVFARDKASSISATSGLDAYGIPFELVVVPSTGITLPTLNSSTTKGNYGGIIILSEVSYSYAAGWSSALTDSQFAQLYAYQTRFAVRMVRLDVYPGAQYGTTTAIAGAGCCNSDVDQLISFTNDTDFKTANIKVDATMTTDNIWHYPAVITDPSTTWEVAAFHPDTKGQFTTNTVAAVINDFGGRQQMAWFTAFATSWSATSNFIQHAHIHWMTRGLFVGARKTYLSTQIDDVHLANSLYLPAGGTFRITSKDLIAHTSWMNSLNARLPSGSDFIIELGHNGNGDIIQATINSTIECDPSSAIYYAAQTNAPAEFQKPLGSGMDLWPLTPTSYTWSVACAKRDELAAWLMIPANRDAFAHVSHTYTHQNLDNSTYSDVNKEIFFNAAWMESIGIAAGAKYSGKGLIPPQITGLHNGDAIKAFLDNGITTVVGDNSRPVLMNAEHPYWPLISNVEDNGYDGLVIVPRYPTSIYYNCDTLVCTHAEWVATSGGTGDSANLLKNEKTVNTRNLLALRHDPYMFHQTNLRAADADTITIGSQTGQFSLLQMWVETVTQEMARLTDWPIVTLKHDDIAVKFLERKARDLCNPNLAYSYSSDGKSITGVTVTANGNACSAPIPVTFPGTAEAASSVTKDKVGSEPLIMWVTLSGSPVEIKLGSAIAV